MKDNSTKCKIDLLEAARFVNKKMQKKRIKVFPEQVRKLSQDP